MVSRQASPTTSPRGKTPERLAAMTNQSKKTASDRLPASKPDYFTKSPTPFSPRHPEPVRFRDSSSAGQIRHASEDGRLVRKQRDKDSGR